ncbi:lipopolysaccharide assembly protein LapB [Candidatus Thiosymbion oneisti]|uniref:lipopolysaccharide assembly protein LapB n=1 Tax=Candidatus Thiosymbion oneisti TaxID=589554 RepID=UPI000B018D1A|nr:lipopolysaccharide assembly protein LapB [Candidatus Thiosymbion oneisti]
MSEWLFLLLPVAAVSGWWVAKRGDGGQGVPGPTSDPAFFRGLNYLLDEQPDKAIDIFVKLAEVNDETAEVHLALGSLFRRRGEVDRAIRIHQNLVSRPNLSKEERGYALFELGQDYMRAGLFDRAERMFRELMEMQLHRKRALEGLREIYQQEKDWARCLEVAEQLWLLTGESVGAESAQYHCELAEESLKAGNGQQAATHLSRAQAMDSDCIRATMLQARMAMSRGDSRATVALYHRLARQGSQFQPEILSELVDTYRRSGLEDELSELKRLYRAYPSPALAMTLTDVILDREGNEAAIAFLIEHITGQADLAGLERLLELYGPKLTDDAQTRAAFDATLAVVGHLRSRQPDHQCEHCGFVARRLHWQCPSCKYWGSIKPIQPEPIGNRAPAPPTAALPEPH